MIGSQFVPIVSVSAAMSVATYALTPWIGRELKEHRIVGTDVHKAAKPKIPEMGGIAIILPLAAFLACIYAFTAEPGVLFVLASTAFFGAYGVLDDMKKLGKYQKLSISLGIALALIIPLGQPLMAVPVLILFTLGLGNIFNTFAGFNGLEMGCSALISFFFSAICIMTGNVVPFYISLGLSAILFSFLLHNKYPARIFPGNVGTLTVGGALAGVCLYYNLYALIIPLMMLHMADLALKAVSAGFISSADFGRTRVAKDGTLVPRRDYLSLAKVVLQARPMGERNLVLFFWAACAAVGTTTVMVLGVML